MWPYDHEINIAIYECLIHGHMATKWRLMGGHMATGVTRPVNS